MQVTIGPVEARDRAAWEPLWDGHIRFYEGQAIRDQTLADAAIVD